MNLRTTAARVIFQVVFSGCSLSESLANTFTTIKAERDQAWLQALCYGVCRRYFYLQALVNLLIEKPLKEKDQDILALLLVGLYQLTDMRVPEYAAIAETVAAVKDFKKNWAKGLVNAVLRRYQREAEDLNQKLIKNTAFRYEHPQWMLEKFKKSWPQQWESIIKANNEQAPLVLRVNQRRLDRDAYLENLAAAQIKADSVPETRAGIVLAKPLDVAMLPGFADGDVSVQDGAAQLAAELLEPAPGLRVLDACAAPGGKTTHIAEMQSDLAELLALDNDPQRLQIIHENLQRLHLSAKVIHADAGNTAQWWDGNLFDRILLDAPCSASGVIRRHPDIKLLRRPADIVRLSEQQFHLLTALWPLLKINGVLLYSTCSIFPEENADVVRRFMMTQADAREEKISGNWGQDCVVGKQIFPGGAMDGFYYARLRKTNIN